MTELKLVERDAAPDEIDMNEYSQISWPHQMLGPEWISIQNQMFKIGDIVSAETVPIGHMFQVQTLHSLHTFSFASGKKDVDTIACKVNWYLLMQSMAAYAEYKTQEGLE